MKRNRDICHTILIVVVLQGLGETLLEAQPVNDSACSAIELEINDTCSFSVYSNIDATDSEIPDPGCGSYEGGDIWFRVAVPDSDTFEIQTDTEAEFQFPLNNGWMYRAAMSIYTGRCDSLVFMDCYENNSTYHPRMAGAVISGQTPGDTIWVRIWEYSNNDNGMLKICASSLDQGQCPTVYEVSGGGTFCKGEPGINITLSGSEHGYLYTLLLNDTIEISTRMGHGDTLIWPTVADSGNYTVLAHHPSQECSLLMSDSAIVTVLELPQLSFEAVSVTCFEFNDGTINSTVSGGKEPYEVLWSGPEGFSSSQPDLANLSPGSYSMTVLDSNQCANAGPDITITEPDLLKISLEQVTHLSNYEANDGAVDINIGGGTTPYTVLWTGSDDYISSDQDPTGMTVGYYAVLVTDDHFCRDSMEMIMVSVEDEAEEIFIPEGFSPNGDGYNDLFVILGIENHPENELVVFNRQGVEVFHCINYKNDWDGTPEKGGIVGGILPEGTYYYVFAYGETSVRKGFIYLNRE